MLLVFFAVYRFRKTLIVPFDHRGIIKEKETSLGFMSPIFLFVSIKGEVKYSVILKKKQHQVVTF